MSRNRESGELSYAVRLRVVFKHLGQLCLIAAILACVPGFFAIAVGEFRVSLTYFAAAILPAGVGLMAMRFTAPRRVQRNEAIVIATLIFPIAALTMCGPYIAVGLSFEDALFEAISGVTTTGLTTLPAVENQPRSFLFARAWQQWYGGLGIIVLSLALTAHPSVSTRWLGLAETPEEDLLVSTRVHARRVFLIYVTITAAGLALLWALGMSWFDALSHTLAAVSTGGFSSHDASLADFASFPQQLATVAFSFFGAVSLPVYWRVRAEGWRVLLHEFQVIVLLALTVGATLMLVGFMTRGGESLSSAARRGSVMALSAQTTVGFSNMPASDLDAASKIVLIIAMSIGGCSESTAGGFKVLRLLIMFRLLHTVLLRSAISKHAVYEPHLGDRRLEDQDIQAAILIMLLFVFVVVASWVPFVASGFDPLDSLFEVVSATGTVGLSAGICDRSLPSFLKVVLEFDMLLGRLEFIALLIVLSPRTWFGKRAASI